MRLYCNDAAMGTARLPECGGEPLSGLFATYECRGQRSFIRRGWAHQWYQIEERREYPRTIGDRCGWQALSFAARCGIASQGYRRANGCCLVTRAEEGGLGEVVVRKCA